MAASIVNLTDERDKTSAFPTAQNFGADIVAFNKPRTWKIGLHYAF